MHLSIKLCLADEEFQGNTVSTVHQDHVIKNQCIFYTLKCIITKSIKNFKFKNTKKFHIVNFIQI